MLEQLLRGLLHPNVAHLQKPEGFGKEYGCFPSISFPEPTCLLVSIKTQSSGIINFLRPETKILGLPLSQRMRALVYMASRDNVDAFHKSIQNALKRLGKSKFGFEITVVSKFKSKRHVCSGFELVDYSRAPFLVADQKTRGLWERDWFSVCLKN